MTGVSLAGLLLAYSVFVLTALWARDDGYEFPWVKAVATATTAILGALCLAILLAALDQAEEAKEKGKPAVVEEVAP